jgi:group I intron endonuclease
MGYIYLITNQITKKQYVGQTIRMDIERRWKDHRNCDKHSIGRCLLNAYLKYGIENFKFQIICICFDEACNQLEEDYIKKFNTLAPNGYNLESGGNNSKCHPETKKLISEKLKGRLLTPITPELLKKRSEAIMGSKNHNFGKKITEVRRSKLSNAIKKIWQERRDNGTFDLYVQTPPIVFEKGRISENRKGVGKYDDKGTLLETYASTVEAGEKNNVHRQSISKVCNGNRKYKTAGGFVWKFL